MSTWKIPAPFRYYTAGQDIVAVHGQTVKLALEDLIHQYPALKQQLRKTNGDLRSFVNIFIDGQNIKDLQGLETPIHEEDELRLVPSIAGG